jgi:mRNA interferase YafQ
MKEIFQTSQFKKDYKRAKKRGKDLDKLKHVVGMIIAGRPLEERHRDHALGGNWVGSRDCHIESDWVLIYRVDGESLYLERTGTHSDLFRK